MTKNTSVATKKNKYQKSLNLYIVGAAVEYFISLLFTNAFLAKVTASLAIPDYITGIITSFISLGGTFQLFSMFIFRKQRVKKGVVFLDTLNQFIFALIYIIPLLTLSAGTKQFAFVAFMLIAYAVFNLVNSAKLNWYMTLIDDDKRGVFTANKEIVSLLSGMVFNLLMGYMIDYFEASGRLNIAFLICALSILVFMIIHFITLIFTVERTDLPELPADEGFFKSIGQLVSNKKVLKVLGICVLWNVAVYSATPFYGTYQIQELGFDMTFVSVIITIHSLVRAAVSRFWGKYADKHGFVKMSRLCFCFAALGFFINIFTVPANGKVFYTMYYMFYAVAMAGVNSSLVNLIYDCVEPKFQRNALVLQKSVSGILGFFATVVVGFLVSRIQGNGNSLFGIQMYAQQAVSVIAFLLLSCLVLFSKKAFKSSR